MYKFFSLGGLRMSFIKSRVYGAFLVGAALVFGLPQAEATEIKFALEMYEGDNPEYNAAKAFKDYVENKSNGELTVRLFPGNQLGSVRDTTEMVQAGTLEMTLPDRKSTRLNSSHVKISYAVSCLKKKNGGN